MEGVIVRKISKKIYESYDFAQGKCISWAGHVIRDMLDQNECQVI